MINKCIGVLVLMNVFFGFSQSVVKKSFLNPEVNAIHIDGTNLSVVQVATYSGKEVLVEATIEGEYTKDLFISLKEESPALYIAANFKPSFKKPNDKLSAHKVLSIVLNITIPKDRNVSFLGTNTNFHGRGKFTNLKVALTDGYCQLAQVSGAVSVVTQSGDILVSNTKGKFSLKSTYGIVEKDVMPPSKSHFNLSTSTGNIQVKKMK